MSIEQLPATPVPQGSQRRLLVLAPHCDDETLGLGGLIADARANGAMVSVAFLTNGDGFRVAASRELKKPVLAPDDFVHFAERRQKEALAATRTLGVPEADVVFLGFPDRGLMPLWQDNWSDNAPYRSAYTGRQRCPYSRCQTPQALYSGESLTRELVKLLQRVRPTDVFVTHPSDDHPDHSAAPAFARTAMARTGCRATLRYYLVHRGDWPLPQGLHSEQSLLPPTAMTRTDTRWESVPLSPSARAAKKAALEKYPSQLALTERFLTSFVRTNELVATLPSGSRAWRDPEGDNLARFTNPSADITGVSATTDGAALNLRVTLRGRALPRIHYVAHLRSPQGQTVTLHLKPVSHGNGRSAEGSIPLQGLGLGTDDRVSLWASVETYWSRDLIVDRTGFRELVL